MVTVLNGIKDQWIPRAEIKEIGDFLLIHPEYLYPLNNFVTQTRCVCHLHNKLELALKEAASLDVIKEGDVTNQFATLSTQFVKYDLANSGHARGDLLEYLCYSKGPFNRPQFGASEILRFRRCTIQNECGEALCGGNNVDVGFAHACEVILELQECKYRLVNFLDESTRTKRKLDYMRCIQQRLGKGSIAGPVVFVTMQFDSRSEENTLKQMGYDFTVYSFEDVLSLIAC